MRLNSTSYAHQKIRLYAHKLEQLTGMKLVTNFHLEFNQIRFENELGYIIIDWQKNTCFTLGFKMTQTAWWLISDILVNLNFLETGLEIQNQRKNRLK